MIHTSKLVKRFGLKAILRGVDFEAAPGEFVALIGPNGAGKTTFLRILSTLSRPTAGLVKVAGFRLPQQATYVRRRLGVLSHQPLLYSELTAEENLKFFGRMYSVNDLGNRISYVLEMVGLEDRGRDLVRTFSRGMQQRLAIGRAVLHDPEILLLDEPYTGLDQDACAMLDQILLEVAGQGRTVVMTSHDLARVENMATRYDVLSRGKIVSSEYRKNMPKDGLLSFYRRAIEEAQVVR